MRALKNARLQDAYLGVLIAIIVLSMVIRLWQLGSIPGGFHQDEVANTYIGRYILLNGTDLHGNPYPLFYADKFGDYPPVLPMYLSALGTFLFGVNEWGSRFVIAFMGALSVIPVYLLALWAYKNKVTALFTAGLLAILPWHVFMSRANMEGVAATFVFLVGITTLLHALRTGYIRIGVIGMLVTILSMFMYPSMRIIVPLALLPLPFMAGGMPHLRRLLTVGVVGAFLIFIAISSTVWGQGRFKQTSLFTGPTNVPIRIEMLIYNETNPLIARAFNNKVIAYAYEFLRQYFAHLNPIFLFSEQGLLMPYVGLLYLSVLLLFIASISSLVQKQNRAIHYPLFYWFLYVALIAPIPAALTITDIPNMHRAFLLSIAAVLIAGYGFNGLLSLQVKHVRAVYLLVAFLCIEFILFSHNYFQHISMRQNPVRNPGHREAMRYILLNQNAYDKVYISRENFMSLYYLFYKNDFSSRYTGKFEPKNFIIGNIDNVHFSSLPCPSVDIVGEKEKLTEKVLIFDSTNCGTMLYDPKKTHEPLLKQIDIIRSGQIDAFRVLTNK